MKTAHGTFHTRMTPHTPLEASSPDIGRLHFDKDWMGALTGRSVGEMLSFGNPAGGTASYVVLEVFTGTLHGRAGTFALRQVGDMHAGAVTLAYEVVAHSAGGDLEGLSGRITLTREGGAHVYVLDHTLPETP